MSGNISMRFDGWEGNIYLNRDDERAIYANADDLWICLKQQLKDCLKVIIVERVHFYENRDKTVHALQYKIGFALENQEGRREYTVGIAFSKDQYAWFTCGTEEEKHPAWINESVPLRRDALITHAWDFQMETLMKCFAWWIKRHSNERLREAQALKRLSESIFPEGVPI